MNVELMGLELLVSGAGDSSQARNDKCGALSVRAQSRTLVGFQFPLHLDCARCDSFGQPPTGDWRFLTGSE